MKKVIWIILAMVFSSGMAFGDSCSTAPVSSCSTGKGACTTPVASAVTEVTKEASNVLTTGMDRRQQRRQQRRGSVMDAF